MYVIDLQKQINELKNTTKVDGYENEDNCYNGECFSIIWL